MDKAGVPYGDMFTAGLNDPQLRASLVGARVMGAQLNKESFSMNLQLLLRTPMAEKDVERLCGLIAESYGLRRVTVQQKLDRPPEPEKPQMKADDKPRQGRGKAIYGMRKGIGDITPMVELNPNFGRASVRGRIFAVNNKETRKGGMVMSFDMTDGSGSIRVSRFCKEDAEKEAAGKLKPGMWVTVCGMVSFNRFENDAVLEPSYIEEFFAEERRDNAKEKRVELHMHTSMSAMDALPQPEAVVKKAMAWGHKAVAITDHGVCSGFPKAMSAAKGKIKVLYGIECYYINDVDASPILRGVGDSPIDGDYVAFDIETTGLDHHRDRITEIGAVIMRDGMELARFQTFVDPGKPIPTEITELTGIRDEDVAGAPCEEDAVRAFIDFVGNRPICAHNALFDMSFIENVAHRMGVDFAPDYINTVEIARCELPKLKNHKLDTVAAALGLAEFRHHRASDDAVTCGGILHQLLLRAKDKGAEHYRDLDVIYKDELQDYARRHQRPKHMIIFAQNKKGLRNLYYLVTRSFLDHFKRNPIMPKSEILEHKEGLIIGAACEAGEMFGLVRDWVSWRELERLGAFYDYFEIQPICNNLFMLNDKRNPVKDEEELRDFNRRIVELGKRTDKPVCATCDAHFIDPEDEIYRHVLLVAQEFEDGDKSTPIYFRTTEEMLEEFSYLGEEEAYRVVVTNTNLVADMIEDISPLPPDGQLYPPIVENSAEDLKSLVYGKLHDLYGDEPEKLITDRVDKELVPILERGYDVMYMIAQKLVADSLAHGYLVGSRGSVGSSLVAFLSGITEVNSLPPHYRCPKCKHTDFESGKNVGCGVDMPDAVCPVCGTKYEKDGFNIAFETFLGYGGTKVPDIDLNFSGEYQANAHKYTVELFGADHVFRAGTIGTLAEKTAFGYVKKYLERTGKVVSHAEEARLAAGCVGVRRTTGQHPGGLVVVPQNMEIYDFCPAQFPGTDTDANSITTHFEYHSMESNLLKLDELGHDDPTMIKMLEDMTGIDAKLLPLDDPETMSIFRSMDALGLSNDDPILGDIGTIGIPEFNTHFTRQMLKDVDPKNFDALLRISGFSHGTDVWIGNIKDLIINKIADINDTVGCRDDIMNYLIAKGMEPKLAFNFMEAVRKGVIHKGKSWPAGVEDEMHRLNVPEWYIESCRKIQYLFPRAHAVAYVMMAFRIAWFKVHEPLAFYSAHFYRRCQKDNFSAEIMTQGEDAARAYIRACDVRRNQNDLTAKDEDYYTTMESVVEFYARGFRFLPVDIYKSDPVKFLPEGEDGLRVPFLAIPGLGEAAAISIAENRENGFISEEDVLASCPKLTKGHMEMLRKLGALRGMAETNQISLF